MNRTKGEPSLYPLFEGLLVVFQMLSTKPNN